MGTNSIGWAVVNLPIETESQPDRQGRIRGDGSRVIPMDAAQLGDFSKGNTVSQTRDRTLRRSARRLLERSKLRRERLHRVLRLMGFLPEHYDRALDRYGRFLPGREPKLPWASDGEGHPRFLFQTSFEEMLSDFRIYQPHLLAEGRKIPYDWTLYYLRKKALTLPLTPHELAWILLSFNQKRGYYQLRSEEKEEKPASRREEYRALRVLSVEDSGERKGAAAWYNVHLEGGLLYRRASSVPPDWEGKVKDFIITTELNSDGTEKLDKDGRVKRSFRAPKEDDWTLLKQKTQHDIDLSGKTVGSYIYDALLRDPAQKIRGRLVHTVDRKYYRKELQEILKTQGTFHQKLQDKSLLAACAEELYPHNAAHRAALTGPGRSLAGLLIDDILFYQRPLRSKKGLIDECPYESHTAVDRATGEVRTYPLKCIARSHPLFQEFRLWQFVSNLRIYQRLRRGTDGRMETDADVTAEFLRTVDERAALFDWLGERKETDQKALLGYPPFGLKKGKKDEYRWNYVEDKAYPCGETRALLLARLKKAGMDKSFLTPGREERLWHILYSVSDPAELHKALLTFARKQGVDEAAFAGAFCKTPPFASSYGAYSAKALKRLLPLMRTGRHWSAEAIDPSTRGHIDKMLAGECDEEIRRRMEKSGISLHDITSFRGLPAWLACYVVYGRHSEARETDRWQTPADIDAYLNGFRQHSLHNPVVEQVVTETLRTVRDIWRQVGSIDEIHVELGREMKAPKEKRAAMTRQIRENENANLRIKALLTEFMNPEFEIENVRPYSPSQQDLLRIYEEGALGGPEECPDEITEILKKFSEVDVRKRPTRSEILRYKLWLEQRYRSPYTGATIPLGKLFTPDYEIEHIIPRSRYFDDSFSNKVICESAVNKLKDNQLGHEFIKRHHGEKVPLEGGRTIEVFSEEAYLDFVREHYGKNRAKMKKLLLEDIPEGFTQRQLGDSRYISRLVTSLLSRIVREEGETAAVSKNVVVCTGSVTDRLKHDWGLDAVWNHIVLPRFRRLNQLTGTRRYTALNSNLQEIPDMPPDQQRGYSKKRIDHRHHALDAIVIACASRNIVNYLSNISASADGKTSRHDLQRLLCDKTHPDSGGNYQWRVKKPWGTFTQDVRTALENTVVSFKQNLRVINKAVNHYEHYDATGKKTRLKQEKGDNWAIRLPMHKDTVYGEVNLRQIATVPLRDALKSPHTVVERDLKRKLKELLAQGLDEKQIRLYFGSRPEIWPDVDLKKISVYRFSKEGKDRYFATRQPLDASFDRKKIEEKLSDTGIRKILLHHLEANGDDPVVAFSPEGIDRMNRNLADLNGGKPHQPIYKVRVYEKADKFAVGERGNKGSKFVEAAKGTNLFFAIYEEEKVDKETGKVLRKRSYSSVPLNVAIDRLKRRLPPAPEDAGGAPPRFVLSPGDLVYVPAPEERVGGQIRQPLDRNRIYKMVSCTGSQCHFVPATVAKAIVDKVEFEKLNKMERALTGEMIKEVCVPLAVDRLGNVRLKNDRRDGQ